MGARPSATAWISNGRDDQLDRFPATRYQGSKRKLLGWIGESIGHLAFDSCLDLFSGTAAASYLFKVMGKRVTSNDALAFNQVIARALVVNDTTTLPAEAAAPLWRRHPERSYRGFISETFSEVFFLDAENSWLDVAAQNIARLPAGSHKDLALFALYQACLAKRPYNLFHRANLYMRTAEVQRGFGNKATWDRPFIDHVTAALAQANAALFANGRTHQALCGDCLEVPGQHDLVYLDPPYVSGRGVGVDYLDFYHFLEGLTAYHSWPEQITTRYKHKPYRRRTSPWTHPETVGPAFDAVIDRFRDAIIVISYRSDGIPSVPELMRLLARHGRRDARRHQTDHRYVLSTTAAREVLLVSEPRGG